MENKIFFKHRQYWVKYKYDIFFYILLLNLGFDIQILLSWYYAKLWCVWHGCVIRIITSTNFRRLRSILLYFDFLYCKRQQNSKLRAICQHYALLLVDKCRWYCQNKFNCMFYHHSAKYRLNYQTHRCNMWSHCRSGNSRSHLCSSSDNYLRKKSLCRLG